MATAFLEPASRVGKELSTSLGLRNQLWALKRRQAFTQRIMIGVSTQRPGSTPTSPDGENREPSGAAVHGGAGLETKGQDTGSNFGMAKKEKDGWRVCNSQGLESKRVSYAKYCKIRLDNTVDLEKNSMRDN